ncbi:MAG TPA: hypothetical protein VGQ05_16090 [Streptosporangiaceae bacterium]|jgi:hypothetical protein|nr:hypothetical protein [Streptosporangiaceae bacterium]
MLKINGDDQAAVQNLLTMLKAAASIGELQGGDPVRADRRSSAALHRCLLTIINDDDKHSQVNVRSGRIHFGTFGEWQNLNAVNAIRINVGAPGMGVAIAFHEIWENYATRSEHNEQGRYGPAHASALAVERDIATELTGQAGGRVAAVALGAGGADGYVLDYEQYFLVLAPKQAQDQSAGQFNAALRDRRAVDDFTIDGLTAGERVAGDRVSEVAGALQANPRATAKIAGHRTGAEPAGLAAQRALAVRSAIIHALDPDEAYAPQGGSIILRRDASSPGTTLGALRAWVGEEQVVGDEPGATIEVEEPGNPL